MPTMPGDIIIDRCLPDASEAERERARGKLQEYARWLLDIAIAQVRAELHGDDSHDASPSGTMESAHPPPP